MFWDSYTWPINQLTPIFNRGSCFMADRADWVDYGKGLGIILVVYAHLLSSGFHAGLSIQKYFFLLSDSIIYSFHMPLFFFLAGLVVEKSFKRRGFRDFLTNKLKFIAYPYLIWSLLQGGIELFFSKHSYRGINIFDILSIPYLPLAQFWFFYALAWMFFVYAVFVRVKRYNSTTLLLVSFGLFFSPYSTEIMGLHGFFRGFVFFVLGVVARRILYKKLEDYPFPLWSTILIFIVFIAASYTVFEYLIVPTRLTGGAHPLIFLFLAPLGVLWCIGLSQFLAKCKYFTFIRYLGVYSLQIFLVHMLAGIGTRIVLLKVFQLHNPIIHMIFGVSAGLLVPIMIYKVAVKMQFPYLFEPTNRSLKA